MCTPQGPSHILGRHCCHVNPTVLHLDHQIITCLILWKEAIDETLQNTMLQGWQGRESNLYWVGLHAVVHRWKKNVDKNGENIVKNNYAFSYVVGS